MTGPSARNHVLLLVYTAATTLLLAGTGAKGPCPTGWFGPNCRYQCHCEVHTACALEDGSCAVDDRCIRGYFGPGCQYNDIGILSSVYSTPRYLLDNNDSTCNPDPKNTQVFLNWEADYVVYWFRIVLNDGENRHNLRLSLEGEPCINQRMYAVTEASMDIMCDNTRTIQWIDLTGEAVGGLCSVYINIGRNVALKQRTRQSSNSNREPARGQSSHAVDGNTDVVYERNSCTLTDEERNPTWEVLFDRPYLLGRISVYNNKDFFYALVNYTIQAYNGENLAFNITSHTNWLNIYQFNIESPFPSTSVKITSLQQHSLTLCEVVIFGEAVCPDGTYGMNCERNCTCSSQQSCNTVTGACSGPCRSGRFGFRCQHYCSETCDGDCLARSGHCISCETGYRGAFCTEDCSPGTYGRQCRSVCSQNCNDTCDPVTGSCTCRPGHVGMDCTDRCPPGKFGVDCRSNCSIYCLNTCDISTGHCNCTHNRTGSTCAECSEGQFGELCDELCPAYCADKKCDEKTHTCFSCADGLQGEYCQSVAGLEDNAVSTLKLILMLLPFVALIVFFLLVAMGSPQSTEDGSKNIH